MVTNEVQRLSVATQQREERFDRFGGPFKRNLWAQTLLQEFHNRMPEHARGGMVVARIVSAALEELDNQQGGGPFNQQERDAIILGAALHDIGKTDQSQEESAYDMSRRWRDDPNALQWAHIQRHPGESRRRIRELDGYPWANGVGRNVGEIVYLHHAFKRKDPYPIAGIQFLDLFPRVVRDGARIIAGVDVADAITNNQKGEGRAYAREEFANSDLTTVHGLATVVWKELDIPWGIASLAAEKTLQVKRPFQPHKVGG